MCGDDGLTYINECKADCEKTTVLCEGNCPCQGGNDSPTPTKSGLDDDEVDIGLTDGFLPEEYDQGEFREEDDLQSDYDTEQTEFDDKESNAESEPNEFDE